MGKINKPNSKEKTCKNGSYVTGKSSAFIVQGRSIPPKQPPNPNVDYEPPVGGSVTKVPVRRVKVRSGKIYVHSSGGHSVVKSSCGKHKKLKRSK